MRFFKQKHRPKADRSAAVAISQGMRSNTHPFSMMEQYVPLSGPEVRLYEAIREGVPVIDAAILKTVRLVGGFEVRSEKPSTQRMLDQFVQHVNVGGISMGLESFIACYLDSLITYGNAIGEMVLDYRTGGFTGLYNADISPIQVKPDHTKMAVDFYLQTGVGALKKVTNKDMILFNALNPKAGQHSGISVLRSLPFVTSILFKIYHAIGQNFDRIGNIRYAVTYKPSGDMVDKSYAIERAEMIGREWSAGMRASANGDVKDFITVGDVNIKAIGADNQVLDTDIPVRHMLEQIVAKMGIPPFLLGFSWSTTERMSQQQTDILTTELDFYRRLLTPVILKICTTYLRFQGIEDRLTVAWDIISLKDEIEQAHSKLYLAQAKKLEQEIWENEQKAEQGGITSL